MNFLDKTVLITGANGLIGLPTVQKVFERGAGKVIAVDIRTNNLNKITPLYPNLIVKQIDLTYLDKVENLFIENKIDIVLHLAGVKGSPVKAKNNPADFMFPMLMFNTNIFHAAYKANVDWLVYLSSIGVYQPADIMKEDDVWQTMPSKNDWYPGWAKRCGELALESLQVQYQWNKFTTIRPANVFGRNDDFNSSAMVIPSNIWKIFNSPDGSIECWGDGSPRRDFVYAEDVADGVLDATEKEINDVINFGSGKAISIKETIDILVKICKEKFNRDINVKWDTTKPNGDLLRFLDSTKQNNNGILVKTTLEEALLQTMSYYITKQKEENL